MSFGNWGRDMAYVTSFDRLKQMHEAALVGGTGSKAWIDFAVTMMDSFPALHRKIEVANAALVKLERAMFEVRRELP